MKLPEVSKIGILHRSINLPWLGHYYLVFVVAVLKKLGIPTYFMISRNVSVKIQLKACHPQECQMTY